MQTDTDFIYFKRNAPYVHAKKPTKTHDLKPLQNNKHDTYDPGADWDDLQTQEIVRKLYIYVIIFNPND